VLTLDNWQTIGSIVAVAAIGVYNAVQARRANKQTQATGNGFAQHVRSELGDIKDGLRTVEGLVIRHLEDHAESDLRRK
jgi:hypothetical protein